MHTSSPSLFLSFLSKKGEPVPPPGTGSFRFIFLHFNFTKALILLHNSVIFPCYDNHVPRNKQLQLQKSLFFFFLSLMKNLRCQARRFFIFRNGVDSNSPVAYNKR
jgi:hypothetical protein